MISTFVREQQRYTQDALCKIFDCTEEKVIPLIRKLKEFGVLKVVKATDEQKNLSELANEDIEVAEVEKGEDKYLYVFTFVGIIVIVGCVIKSYPKYLTRNKEPLQELKQVIKVIKKYNAREQIVQMYHESNESTSFNFLSVLIYLINDYFDYGTYSNTQDIIESNGSGEILWDKTINETITLISNYRPFYVDLRTKKRVNDDYDFFKRLHECILTLASRELKKAGLLDIFDISVIDLSENTIDSFGDRHYLLYRIENELSRQFNSRKQLVLKTMYAYIKENGSLHDTNALSLFGTNSFNLIWEKVCADILDNQLESKLGRLNLPIKLKEEYDRNLKLIELIEKPLWSITEKTADMTLIPDLITISKTGEGWHFIIFDAKYYKAKLEKGSAPTDQPGIESITKQYLYQLAYKSFIEGHNFTTVKNCFLMPTENDEIEDKGEVSMEMLSNLGLQNIQVRFIPAKMAYEYYLSDRKMDIAKLGL